MGSEWSCETIDGYVNGITDFEGGDGGLRHEETHFDMRGRKERDDGSSCADVFTGTKKGIVDKSCDRCGLGFLRHTPRGSLDGGLGRTDFGLGGGDGVYAGAELGGLDSGGEFVGDAQVLRMGEPGSIIGLGGADVGLMELFLSSEFCAGEIDRGASLLKLSPEGSEFAGSGAFAHIGEPGLASVKSLGGLVQGRAFGGVFEREERGIFFHVVSPADMELGELSGEWRGDVDEFAFEVTLPRSVFLPGAGGAEE